MNEVRTRCGVRFAICTTAVLLSVACSTAIAQNKLPAREQLKANGIEILPERLVQYAAQGDIVTVNLLIDAGLSVNAADPVRHVTALHNAAAQGHARIVQRLLELGADVNARDWWGVTPLIAAAGAGQVAIVSLLVQKGADVNVVPEKAPTALIAAIQQGSLKTVDLLLAAKAQIDLSDGVGQTPLSAAKLANRGEILTRLETISTGHPR